MESIKNPVRFWRRVNIFTPRHLCETPYFQGYLNANGFSTANHTDLWRALGAQARADGLDVDVPSVMNTWVRQMGYPVVTMTLDRQARTLRVTQQHFLLDATKQPDPRFPSPFG